MEKIVAFQFFFGQSLQIYQKISGLKQVKKGRFLRKDQTFHPNLCLYHWQLWRFSKKKTETLLTNAAYWNDSTCRKLVDYHLSQTYNRHQAFVIEAAFLVLICIADCQWSNDLVERRGKLKSKKLSPMVFELIGCKTTSSFQSNTTCKKNFSSIEKKRNLAKAGGKSEKLQIFHFLFCKKHCWENIWRHKDIFYWKLLRMLVPGSKHQYWLVELTLFFMTESTSWTKSEHFKAQRN